MQYSLNKINTVQACDDLLARAQRKRRTLDRRRRNLGEAIGAFSKRIDRIHQEMTDVRASLAALTPAYHAIPEGGDKATINIMIKRLEVRLARLEKQAYTCNVVFLLVKEMKYNALESQVSAMDEYIDGLETIHKVLSQPVMYISGADDFSRPPLAQPSWQHALVARDTKTRQLEPEHVIKLRDEKNDHLVIAAPVAELQSAAAGMR